MAEHILPDESICQSGDADCGQSGTGGALGRKADLTVWVTCCLSSGFAFLFCKMMQPPCLFSPIPRVCGAIIQTRPWPCLILSRSSKKEVAFWTTLWASEVRQRQPGAWERDRGQDIGTDQAQSPQSQKASMNIGDLRVHMGQQYESTKN